MPADTEPVIVEALRTPIGRRGGALRDVRPDDLAAWLVGEVVERTGLPAAELGDVIVGCATPAGEQGWNIGRQVVLLSGLPVEVPGLTVNRMCASSDQAVRYATQAIAAGEYELAMAVGVESMSRVPMTSDGVSFSPAMDGRYRLVAQGLSAEKVADKWGLSRAAMEELALVSHQRAIDAWACGAFDAEVVPAGGLPAQAGAPPAVLRRDEGPRHDTSAEKLARLRPAFCTEGRVTAGTSSQMSDGAAVVLLASRRKAAELGLRPRARLVTGVTAGSDPVLQLTGVIDATAKALATAGLELDDIAHFEVNEAFAAVPMAWMAETGVPTDRVNPRGGALALGHPLGATGARLLVTMLHALEQRDDRYGLQTMCIGHGMANATIIERLRP
ncbi:MAG: thiolase family protein [Acidimicrobiales bacterium]